MGHPGPKSPQKSGKWGGLNEIVKPFDGSGGTTWGFALGTAMPNIGWLGLGDPWWAQLWQGWVW